ncbi:MAG: YkgJ family cysteine cluster protein [Flavobacteriales bacterium]
MSDKVDVAKFRKRAYRKKKELTAFLKKVGKGKVKGLRKLTKQAEAETWKEINCQKCGNCCMTMTPTWTKKEVKRLAAHLGMTYDEFYQKWLYTEEETGDIMNDSTPCQFFDVKNGLCTVYEFRPHDCATFPHLYRKDYKDQVEVYTNNLHRCPATLVAVEKLKKLVEGKS